jgi:hypothetical protein
MNQLIIYKYSIQNFIFLKLWPQISLREFIFNLDYMQCLFKINLHFTTRWRWTIVAIVQFFSYNPRELKKNPHSGSLRQYYSKTYSGDSWTQSQLGYQLIWSKLNSFTYSVQGECLKIHHDWLPSNTYYLLLLAIDAHLAVSFDAI